ncbi:ABC transporter permease subunit [Cytobacillus firmus]|uniref:ABC transporter permease subunit n=1 Tax=Cytobacillus firmus TaxID=1399 RepID=UPI001F559D93|nr:ABC transporter permease subunit [Cytobacillus firmus]
MLINLSLWMFPIICMILGGNSIIADKENGRLSLYSTYQASSGYYLISKFLALVLSLFFVMGISYGIFSLIFSLAGSSFAAHIYQVLLLVNMLLILVFSAASLLIGAFSKTRIQGLSAAIIFWLKFYGTLDQVYKEYKCSSSEEVFLSIHKMEQQTD